MDKSNRSKHEIFSDILNAIETDEATISEIQFKTYISYRDLKKYLTFLIQHDLISYGKGEKRFGITQKGIQALDLYTKMDALLVRKTLHNVMKATEYIASFP